MQSTDLGVTIPGTNPEVYLTAPQANNDGGFSVHYGMGDIPFGTYTKFATLEDAKAFLAFIGSDFRAEDILAASGATNLFDLRAAYEAAFTEAKATAVVSKWAVPVTLTVEAANAEEAKAFIRDALIAASGVGIIIDIEEG